jgi:hypothetical protein
VLEQLGQLALGGRTRWTPGKWQAISRACRQEGSNRCLCSEGWFHYYPTLEAALVQAAGEARAYCWLPHGLPEGGELWIVEVVDPYIPHGPLRKAGTVRLRPIKKVNLKRLFNLEALERDASRARHEFNFSRWLRRRKIVPTPPKEKRR